MPRRYELVQRTRRIEKVEFEIQVVQAILRQFLGFDRATFGEFHKDGSLVVLSSTAAEGFEATPLW